MCQYDMSKVETEALHTNQNVYENRNSLDKKKEKPSESEGGALQKTLKAEQFRAVELPKAVKTNQTPEERMKEEEDKNRKVKLIDALCEQAMCMVRNFILEAKIQGEYGEWQRKAEKLFESVKTAFSKQNTIECILGKIFSLTTGAKLQSVKEFSLYFNEIQIENMRKVAATLKEPIEQTLNDILYWGIRYQQSSVEKIFLTDSDMHARGVGVCIVTYKAWFSKKKVVIKPEDKSFEKMVYGKEKEGEERSLASIYNKEILEKGKINFVKANNENISLKKESIGKLGIDVSEHGSAVEYYEHDELQKGEDKKVNETSVMALVSFASLLGMADLHRENAVYGGKDRKKIQIIDGETAMKYNLDEEKPLNSVLWNGEMGLGPAVSIPSHLIPQIDAGEFHYDLTALEQFLEKIEEKFKGKRSRIVPLATGVFYTMRTNAYSGVLSKESYFKNFEEGGLFQILKSYGVSDVKNMILKPDELFRKTKLDYLKGRIPFFEYDFSKGAVYQKFSDGTEMLFLQCDKLKLEHMIAQRKHTLEQENITYFLTTIFGQS